MRWLWITGLVIVLDQLSKQLATGQLVPFQPENVLPFLNMTLMFNSGAAFSFLADASGWQRWFFAAIAIIVSVFILLWLKRLPRTDRWLAIALALILGEPWVMCGTGLCLGMWWTLLMCITVQSSVYPSLFTLCVLQASATGRRLISPTVPYVSAR